MVGFFCLHTDKNIAVLSQLGFFCPHTDNHLAVLSKCTFDTQSIHIFGVVYYLSTSWNSPFYIRCYNPHFIAVWTKLDTFYFLIFHSKIRGNPLIRGKLPSLVKLLSWLRASSRGSLRLSKVWSLISFQHLYVPGFDSSYSPLTSKYADSVSKVKGCLSKTLWQKLSLKWSRL